MVIGLVVTPQGFPLAYETMPGNVSEKSTLADFLAAIESRYGRSERVWIMDRGIPTNEALKAMREGDAPASCLAGTPKGRLTALEQAPSRDELLMKLGAARKEAGRAWHLVEVRKPEASEEVTAETFTFALRRERLRRARRREGRCLLRSNLTDEDPETLWRCYMRLTEVEQAFKELKSDLAVRPVFHRLDERVEAHVFLAFVGYCLLVTLMNMARAHAPGLTPSAVIEKFATIQMADVHLPTSDARTRPAAPHAAGRRPPAAAPPAGTSTARTTAAAHPRPIATSRPSSWRRRL